MSVSGIQRNINNMEVLSEFSTGYIRDSFFEGRFLSGGVSCYNNLAERAFPLKKLKAEFDAKIIDLGTKDRLKVMAKWIGVALAVSTVFFVLMLSNPAAIAIIFLAALPFIIGLSIVPIPHVVEVFSRSPQWLEQQINDIETLQVSEKDRKEMLKLEELLNDKIKLLNKDINEKKRYGYEDGQLLQEKNGVESVLLEVKRLRIAVDGQVNIKRRKSS